MKNEILKPESSSSTSSRLDKMIKLYQQRNVPQELIEPLQQSREVVESQLVESLEKSNAMHEAFSAGRTDEGLKLLAKRREELQKELDELQQLPDQAA